MRRQSRELALQILFQTEFAPQLSILNLLKIFDESLDPETVEFAQKLINGVNEFKGKIDSKIQSASSHWKLERMANVDRNVLRISTYEMLFAPELLKQNIAINEAIEIARKYGTTDSANFVNGILDQIAKSK